jgi:hypothetical protein
MTCTKVSNPSTKAILTGGIALQVVLLSALCFVGQLLLFSVSATELNVLTLISEGTLALVMLAMKLHLRNRLAARRQANMLTRAVRSGII